jgi:hypothetical protein
MTQAEVYRAAAAAAVTTLAIVVVILRRASSRQEGVDGVRLLANVMLLGLYWAIFAATAALAVIGYVTKDYDYWFGAMAVFGMGMLLFNDISLTRRNPIAEWFSSTPLSDRVSYLHRDTRRLLDRRRARAAGNEPAAEAEADPYEAPFGTLKTEYHVSQGPPEAMDAATFKERTGIDVNDLKGGKTFTFTLSFGRKNKPS